MTKFILAPVVAVAFMFAGQGAEKAQAGGFGIHIAGPGYHLDIGRVHHRVHRHHGHRHHHHHHRHHRGKRVWHDTTHLDYYPGGFVRHYDHYHYMPGHYRVHRTGHWDRVRW